MHTTISENGQMVLPAKLRRSLKIRPGDVFDVSQEAEKIVFRRLEKPAAAGPVKTRWIRRKGRHTVADTGVPITSEQVKAFLADNFP